MPALVIGPPDDWTLLDKALLDLENFDWIIFSSANGVKSVDQRLQLIGKSLSQIPVTVKIAAMGSKTANLLESMNVVPDFIPPKFIADSLIHNFPESVSGLQILIPRVQTGGRPILAENLSKAGAKIVEVPAYESKCPTSIPEVTKDALQTSSADGIVFTSAKTASHTAQLLQKYFGDYWKELLSEVSLISIGPQTSISCRKYFDRIDKESNKHDLEGVLDACIELMGKD